MEIGFTGKQSDVYNDIAGGTSPNILKAPLFLFREPVEANEATTKQYVDLLKSRVTVAEGNIASITLNYTTKTYVDTQDSAKLSRSGDTMTGTLTLVGDPTSALQAATKAYVDELSIMSTINSLRLY